MMPIVKKKRTPMFSAGSNKATSKPIYSRPVYVSDSVESPRLGKCI